MIKAPRRLLIIYVLLRTVFAFGQGPINFEYISEEDGLSHRWVLDIEQDDAGILWFATYDGLNRYDGTDIKVFRHSDNDSTSISTNTILLLTKDSDGDLWAYGLDRVFNKIHLATGKISKVTTFYKNDTLIAEPVTGLIHFGTLQNGDFISVNRTLETDINNSGCQLFKFSKKLNGFEQILDIPTPGCRVSAVTERSDGKLWLWGFGEGYYLVDMESKMMEYFPVSVLGLKTAISKILPVDQERNFWYPSPIGGEGKTGSLKSFLLPSEIAVSDINRIRLDNFGNIWFNHGDYDLYHFDVTTEVLEKYSDPVFGKTHGLQSIKQFFVDQEGACWIGHFFGALRFINRPAFFNRYLHQPASENAFGTNQVSAREMLELDAATILVKTNDHELYIIDRKSNTSRIVPRKSMSLTGEKVTPGIFSMIMRQDGFLWTNQTNRINRLDLTNGDVTSYTIFTPTNDGEEFYPRIFEDRDQNLWWTCKEGLYLFDDRKGQLNLVDGGLNPHATDVNFKYATYDPALNLIYGTYDRGICVVECKTRSSYIIEIFGEHESDYLVMAVLYWQKEFWLSTNFGLVRYNPETKRRIIYSKKDGLPADIVYSALVSHDHLWLATHSGLCQFYPDKMKVVTYYKEQGLPFNEFNRWSYLKTSDGQLFFGGLNGIVGFNPADFLLQEDKRGLLNLMEVSRYNQSEGIQKTTPNLPYAKTEKIVVGPAESMVLFKYALTSYGNVKKNQYFHFMDGLEPGWIEDGNKNEIRYMQIPPGEYTFRAKATGPNNVSAINEIAIEVIVKQYWYKRWWAIASYALMGILAIVFLYRYQLKRKISQHEVDRIRELDEMKTKMYTNITHEFRTPLTVILGMNKSLKNFVNQGQSDKVSLASEMIARNGKSLLNLVNQMLELSKLESGLLTVDDKQGDIIIYLKYCLESFKSYAAEKAIEVYFHANQEKIIMDYDPDKMAYIISNLMTNAIKFTPEKGMIHVQADYNVDQTNAPYLVLTVRDTGIGIEENKIKHVFDRFYQVDSSHTRAGEGTGIGLSLVHELVKLLKGSIHIKSKVNEGTEFVLRMPITNHADFFDAPESAESDTHFLRAEKNETEEELLPDGDQSIPLILVVEDNIDVRHYISISLVDHYRVVHAKDGLEGINMATDLIPDIIISDVMMPGKDGFELCAVIKQDERTSHIPIILLTGKADFDSKIKGLEHGADVYLTKPFSERELLANIKNLIALRAEMQKRYAASDFPNTVIQPSSVEDVFLIKVRNIIIEHLEDEDFNITQLCESIYLSRAQLHRKITALTGESASGFMRKIKMEKAKELLLNTSWTISEVAYKTGFKTQAHFSRVFSEVFGISPSAYRDNRLTGQ